ncbi:MAG: cytochrome c [Acidobacteriota bacterium]|nr:cytochrome c [Acidobacteriota bacterium]
MARPAKRLIQAAALLVCAAPLFSHDPITTKLTWTQEISRIVYKHCVSCHREGGAAMSLTTYADARPWAKAIRDEVTSRRMPPWGAVQGVGEFQDDPSLTGIEIDMLVAWVEGGAPEGDPAYLPHRIPPAAGTKPAPPHASRPLTVTSELRLKRAGALIAIRPQGLAEGAALEAWAILPDQSVKRLLWLRDYKKAWDRPYVYRVPEPLPAGTTVKVEGGSALLLFR